VSAAPKRPECRTPIRSVDLLGLPISRVDRSETLRLLGEFMTSGRPHLILTADASAVVIAAEDAAFRSIWRRADLVTPDSSGILWAARRFGDPFAERVSGVDLAEQLCRIAANGGHGVFFYGAAPGVADDAARAMEERYPGLRISGTAHGFLSPEEQDVLVERIATARPHVLLVALGIPKQEKWLAANLERLRVPVCIGVGGSLDVFAGQVARAPEWMQRRGLEWLYRLARNPRKVTKVAMLPRFVWMVITRRRVAQAEWG